MASIRPSFKLALLFKAPDQAHRDWSSLKPPRPLPRLAWRFFCLPKNWLRHLLSRSFMRDESSTSEGFEMDSRWDSQSDISWGLRGSSTRSLNGKFSHRSSNRSWLKIQRCQSEFPDRIRKWRRPPSGQLSSGLRWATADPVKT